MLSEALKYLNLLHYSVFPVSQEKESLVRWKKYQKRLPTEDEVKGWWQKWPDANIGIVTGIISGIAVIDLDDVEIAKEALQNLIPDSMVFPIAKTQSGGEHWYFTCVDGKIRNNSRIVPGADLRANGGYVVAPPSITGNGKGWRWVDKLRPDLLALPYLPESYLAYIKNKSINSNIYIEGIEKEKSLLSTNVYKMFNEGTRDEDLFHVANCLFKGRMPESETVQVLEILAKNCNPPFGLKELSAKIASAKKRNSTREINLAEEVELWVLSTNGNFLSTDVYKSLQLSTRDEHKNTSIILKRLTDKGVIEKYGDKNGQFRLIDTEAQNIDWYNSQVGVVDIKYPFGIEQFVHTMPRNLVVVAGSPNAGKSAFMLNVVAMNMDKFKINYFSSEMGAMELRSRLQKFDIPISKWRFTAKERSGNFADVIKPDEVNIIDFMELSEDFWRIGGMLKAIYDKLTTGIALVALQKAPGATMARGGVGSLEKPRLYLTMEAGLIKIEKAKNWAQEGVNPNGQIRNFKLVQGCKFIPMNEWHRKEEIHG